MCELILYLDKYLHIPLFVNSESINIGNTARKR